MGDGRLTSDAPIRLALTVTSIRVGGMSDTSREEDQSLSSAELVKRAKEAVSGTPDDDAIADIVSDLEDIDVDVPTEDRFPEPIPDLQTRPRSKPSQRPRRVTSAYDMDDIESGVDPFDRDGGPPQARAFIVALIALLVVAGGVVAFIASSGM